MSELTPRALHLLTCVVSELHYVPTRDDLDNVLSYVKRVRRACDPETLASLSSFMRELLLDPDADLSPYVSARDLADGGAHARWYLEAIAPIFGVYPHGRENVVTPVQRWLQQPAPKHDYPHVRDDDVARVRRWIEQPEPIAALRGFILDELAQFDPEQRGDVFRAALFAHPGASKQYVERIAGKARDLASGELEAEEFDRTMARLFWVISRERT